MTVNIKTVSLASAVLAILALPVAANQSFANLRGSFPSNYTANNQAYIYSQGYSPKGPATQPYYTQSAYGPASTSALGLRGLSTPYGMRYNPQAANQFWQNASLNMNAGSTTVQTNAYHTHDMLDWQENTTGKAVTLLMNRKNGVLPRNSLTIGGAVKGGFMWQKTDEPGQFPILSRFPFFSERTDDEAGVFAINNAALAFTGTFGDWTTIYMQPEYSETDFPNDQDELQLRKAFVVLGNLDRLPFYLSFGRKTIDFGNFDGYNAFTQTEAQHYFWALSDQPVAELGFYRNGFKIVGSAFSGGRQLRVAYADENNNIQNYAFNAEKEFLLGGSRSFTIGGGYLHDTIYRNNWTAHTFRAIEEGTPPTNFIEYRNSAVNGFAEYNSDVFDIMVEYTKTLRPWAAAIPQDPNGFVNAAYLIDPAGSPNDRDNIDFDQDLEVLVAQARIKPLLPNGRRMSIAAVGSWGEIGDDFEGTNAFGQPTSWKDNQQHAVSLEYPVSPFLDLGVEYVYNKGFIPFVAPQQISNDDTDAHAINIGLKARF